MLLSQNANISKISFLVQGSCRSLIDFWNVCEVCFLNCSFSTLPPVQKIKSKIGNTGETQFYITRFYITINSLVQQGTYGYPVTVFNHRKQAIKLSEKPSILCLINFNFSVVTLITMWPTKPLLSRETVSRYNILQSLFHNTVLSIPWLQDSLRVLHRLLHKIVTQFSDYPYHMGNKLLYGPYCIGIYS